MNKTPSTSPTSKSTKRYTGHSPTAKHVSPDVVQETLDNLGIDKTDQNEINEIMRGVPSKTRKIKESTFSTIVNLNEKWKRHKEKTAEILKQAKSRDMQHREKLTKLTTKLTKTNLENDRLKCDLARLEALCNELQEIKFESSKDKVAKEELETEIKRQKITIDTMKQSIGKHQDRVRMLENDKGKIEADNAKLRISFRKQENKSIALERELRETKVELEMFEEMLKGVPRVDSTCEDFSDLDVSPIGKNPSASRAICSDAPKGEPMFNSTPLVAKPSITTGLVRLANEHKEHERACRELASVAREMKERDKEISRLIMSSDEN